jgi:putative PIN family toxin of toxin-antitoxin system
MRVVADTNIAVSGLLWRGNPRRVLDAARDSIIELFTSTNLLEELEDVLGRRYAVLVETSQCIPIDSTSMSGFDACCWQ